MEVSVSVNTPVSAPRIAHDPVGQGRGGVDLGRSVTNHRDGVIGIFTSLWAGGVAVNARSAIAC